MCNYFFISDEHFGHKNIITYCNRPFNNVDEMDETIIDNHNSVVGKNDIVIHGGDLTMIKNKEEVYKKYINRLKGKHIFLNGSHDYWNKNLPYIFEKRIDSNYIVVCHYAMRVWPRSHYNSFQLFGHSHGKLKPEGKQMDICVESIDYTPISYDDVVLYMENRADNFNLIQT